MVCCYLSSGETPTLTVQKLIPFQGDAQFSSEEIDKLEITITDVTSGKDYQLLSVGDGSYRNTSLIVEAGHEYSLYFIYDNVPVTSATTVPSVPQGVSFSSTTIEVMSFLPPMPMSKAPNDGIEISWTNDEGDYYIVEGKTYSTSPIMEVDDDEDMPSKSFKQNYTQSTGTTLSSSDFNYYGSYNVSVIHIHRHQQRDKNCEGVAVII